MTNLTADQKRSYNAWRARLRAAASTPTKDGKRTPSGQLSRAKDARPFEPPAPPPAVEHRVLAHGLSEEDAKRPEAGTEHGRMFLRGQLTYTAYLVADDYAKAREAWQRVLDGPRVARSAALGYRGDYREQPRENHPYGNPNAAVAAVSDKPETPEDRAERITKTWKAAVEAIGSTRAAYVLNDVAVRGTSIKHPEHHDLLVMALERLAPLWGADPTDISPKR